MTDSAECTLARRVQPNSLQALKFAGLNLKKPLPWLTFSLVKSHLETYKVAQMRSGIRAESGTFRETFSQPMGSDSRAIRGHPFGAGPPVTPVMLSLSNDWHPGMYL